MAKPLRVRINNEWHKAVVLHVLESENGRPTKCRVMLDDDKVKLQGGEQFLIAYVLERSLKLPN